MRQKAVQITTVCGVLDRHVTESRGEVLICIYIKGIDVDKITGIRPYRFRSIAVLCIKLIKVLHKEVEEQVTSCSNCYLCIHIRNVHHITELVQYEMHPLRQFLTSESIGVVNKCIITLIDE